jgi:hypothetical protein
MYKVQPDGGLTATCGPYSHPNTNIVYELYSCKVTRILIIVCYLATDMLCSVLFGRDVDEETPSCGLSSWVALHWSNTGYWRDYQYRESELIILCFRELYRVNLLPSVYHFERVILAWELDGLGWNASFCHQVQTNSAAYSVVILAHSLEIKRPFYASGQRTFYSA